MSNASADILQGLFQVIKSRKGADPASSYTAQLLSQGTEKIARKVAEESIEVVLAAVTETPEHLASESADLLYHLLVLWADAGLDPADVWAALEKRQGTSGIDEKKARS
jgi:phosphoribosyl-ATP pyrophosphohydrolase